MHTAGPPGLPLGCWLLRCAGSCNVLDRLGQQQVPGRRGADEGNDKFSHVWTEIKSSGRREACTELHLRGTLDTAVGRHLVSSGEFRKSFTAFHSLSPERSMSLWPTPGRLTSRAWPPMALVSSFAIQGRVSASSDPLMIRVGQSTLLALVRASNGPMANEVFPTRARSIAQASRLVIGLSSTCALTSRRLARSIATALPRDQPISVTWSRVIDDCRCRYVIAASAER